MLEKLAKQTAIYGISTIVVRFLSYLLSPFYTWWLSREEYGVITDIYALIPFALVVLTMGMESSYFRFAGHADEAGGDVAAAKRHLFATTWGATLAAASVFLLLVVLFRGGVARLMGDVYVAHPQYVVLAAAIIFFDVAAMIPFARLRERGEAGRYVMLKALGVCINVALVFAFAAAGLYDTDFGVGWAFVANLASSVVTLVVLAATTEKVVPVIDRRLLVRIFAYSLPLLIGGVAGTANEFIDRQMIKYLVPTGAMAQLGVYGAITKIAVVMTLFTQMYRLAAEPFFLSNFRKEEFVESNAAALKYYVMVAMGIFLFIALFRDLFALILGRDFREGIFILPVVLGANVLSGVWFNLSFWYKREEKTRFAIYVTFTGLLFTVVFNVVLVPRWGYYGAAWARLIAEGARVALSYTLNRRYFPTPYQTGRIATYVAAGLALFAASELFARHAGAPTAVQYVVNVLLIGIYCLYAVWREHIDVRALAAAVVHRRR